MTKLHYVHFVSSGNQLQPCTKKVKPVTLPFSLQIFRHNYHSALHDINYFLMQAELFHALVCVAVKKQDDIKDIIITTRDSESASIIENAASLKLNGACIMFFIRVMGNS